MSGPGVIRAAARLGCAAMVLCACPLWADGLSDSFAGLPRGTRMSVQRELARADLFLADVDGNWNAATERALLRSVETIALKSNDRLHPELRSRSEAEQYLKSLGDGTYSRLLYGGNLFQRLFYLSVDPVLDIEG